MAAAGIKSRQELADEAKVHPTTISRLIDSPDHPSALDTIRAVADVLGLDVRDAAHWSGLELELDEPYIPPPEAHLLGRNQRRIVDDVIRGLAATNRHPRPPLRIQKTGVVVVADEASDI